jgi:serine/threonine protein kinase
MVMQFERGRTLHDYIQRHRGEVTERFIRNTFTRMLNGLREVHSHKLLHLDIKPSNIYLRADGTPVLLDFGAARQTLSQEQPMLKPMYTPGFASPEQYSNREGLGPWSDVYSVGASMHACIVGSAPPKSDERVQKELYQPVSQTHKGKYSPPLLALVDWCLKLDPLQRPQSVYTVQKELVQPPPPMSDTPPGLFSGFLSTLKSVIDRNRKR